LAGSPYTQSSGHWRNKIKREIEVVAEGWSEATLLYQVLVKVLEDNHLGARPPMTAWFFPSAFCLREMQPNGLVWILSLSNSRDFLA
jgi:hypothetical protein